MEYIDGNSIDEYIRMKPQDINSIFEQLINAFAYLEKKNICHRDIRGKNILVTSKGIVKVIDFGFGKEFTLDSVVSDSTKNNNWICDLPDEMLVSEPKYNNLTDMYFIANLIDKIVKENKIIFKYKNVISRMMKRNPLERYKSFNEIVNLLNEKNIRDLVIVSENEKKIYKNFVDELFNIINKISFSAIFYKDINEIADKLIGICNKNIFEDYVIDNEELVNCFIDGKFTYNETYHEIDSFSGEEYTNYLMPVITVQNFVHWISQCDNIQKS